MAAVIRNFMRNPYGCHPIMFDTYKIALVSFDHSINKHCKYVYLYFYLTQAKFQCKNDMIYPVFDNDTMNIPNVFEVNISSIRIMSPLKVSNRLRIDFTRI